MGSHADLSIGIIIAFALNVLLSNVVYWSLCRKIDKLKKEIDELSK